MAAATANRISARVSKPTQFYSKMEDAATRKRPRTPETPARDDVLAPRPKKRAPSGKPRKMGARRVLRSFRTTPRLLEDEEMDDLLQLVMAGDYHMRQLTTCCIDEWAAVQFGYDDPCDSNLYRTLVGGISDSEDDHHLVSLLNVEVDDEHPHWIVMLVNVARKRMLLVDSLESANEPQREKKKKKKPEADVAPSSPLPAVPKKEKAGESASSSSDDDDDLLAQFQASEAKALAIKAAQAAKAKVEADEADEMIVCGTWPGYAIR
jgi:hypothetical protein